MRSVLVALGLTIGVLFMGVRDLPAQSTDRNDVIKVNPLSMALLTLNARWEHRINQRFAFLLGAHIGNPHLYINSDLSADGIRYFLLGVTPEFRYYASFIKRQPPRGLYASAHMRLGRVRQKFNSIVYEPVNLAQTPADITIRREVISFGFLLGYQVLIKDRLALDFYIGPQYSSSKPHVTILCPGCDGDERILGEPGLPFDGVEPRAGIAVGYAF